MWNSKDVYYISDGTGILASNLGRSLICQFPGINFHEEQFPFITTMADAKKTMAYIRQHSGSRSPLIFSTIMDPEIIAVFKSPEVNFFDGYAFFLEKLEDCLEAEALRVPGFSRRVSNMDMNRRVEAIHYCLEHDDGTRVSGYDDADLILIGVSRAGKTPISVYLASQLGLKTANFPLTEEYLVPNELPDCIRQNISRAVGLTSTPEILHAVREKRYPDSRYANLATCRQELQQAAEIFLRHNIPVISTAGKSIEETATQALQALKLSMHPDALPS